MPGHNKKVTFELTAEDRASRVLRRLDDRFNKLGGSSTRNMEVMQRGARNLERSMKRLGGVIAGAFAFRALARGVAGAIQNAADFQTGLVAVAKTTNATQAEIAKLSIGIETLEKKLPTSSKNLLAMASAAGQLGVKGTGNILAFTETLARLEQATDVVGEQGARDLARLLNITGSSTGDIDNLGSAIVDLGNTAAATEAEIIHMATFVGQSIGQFDASAAEVVGIAAAMKELGLRAESSGSAVGRAFRTIQSATQEGGSKARALAQLMGQSIGEISEAFRTDSVGTFIQFLEGLSQQGERTTAVMKELGLAGDENLKIFPVLARNVDAVRARLEQSNRAWRENTALLKESNTASQTYSAQLQLFQNRLGLLQRSIGRGLLPGLNDSLLQGSALFDTFFDSISAGAKNFGLGIVATFEDLFREILRSAVFVWDAVQAAGIASFNVLASHLESVMRTALNGVLSAAEDGFNGLLKQIEKFDKIPGIKVKVNPVSLEGLVQGFEPKSFGDEFAEVFTDLDDRSERWLNDLIGDVGTATQKLEQITAESIANRKAIAAAAIAGGGPEKLEAALEAATTSAIDLGTAVQTSGEKAASGLAKATAEANRLNSAAESIRARFANPAEDFQRTLQRINNATGTGGLSTSENQEFANRARQEFDEIEQGIQSVESRWTDTMGVFRSSLQNVLRGGTTDFGEFASSIALQLSALQLDRSLFGDQGLFGGEFDLFASIGKLFSGSTLGEFDALGSTLGDQMAEGFQRSQEGTSGNSLAAKVKQATQDASKSLLAATAQVFRPQRTLQRIDNIAPVEARLPEPPRTSGLTLPVGGGIDPGALDLLGVVNQATVAGQRAADAFGQAFVLPMENTEAFTQTFKTIENASANAANASANNFKNANESILTSILDLVKSAIQGLGKLAKATFNAVGSALGSIDLSGIFSGITSFDGGGHTGPGSRSGGMDGKGGFLSLLHPNEQIIDLTRSGAGRALAGGGGGITVINNIQPGVSQEMIPQIVKAAEQGTLAAIRDQGRRGGQRARSLGF